MRYFCIALTCFLFPFVSQSQEIVEADDGGSDYAYGIHYDAAFSRLIDDNLIVGRTAGSHSVSPTGAALYNIPISLPPATAGFAPQLSINYNSQGNESVMGFGWSISAGSMIHRINRDIMHDGETQALDWQVDNPIALDGTRLVKMSGSHLTAGAEYSKEIEDFSKIYVHDSGGEPYFKVWTKGGEILEYGRSADARIHHSSGEPYAWMLEKVSDHDGNAYRYHYGNVHNQKVITKITYSENTASSPQLAANWEIGFEYVQRIDPNEKFINGLSLKQTVILRRLKIKNLNNSQIAKEFFFKYTLRDDQSVLSLITERRRNGERFNSTIISYGNDSQPAMVFNLLGIETSEKDMRMSGDFNGDGLTDIVELEYGATLPASSGPLDIYANVNVELNDCPGCLSFTTTSNTLTEALGVPFSNIGSFLPWRVVDYNGDGIDDLVLMKVSTDNTSLVLESIKIFKGPFTNGVLPTPITINAPSSYNRFKADEYFGAIPGDFNGDGRMDFMSILSDVGTYKGFLTLSGTNVQFEEVLNQAVVSAPDIKYLDVIDFNGDGKTELMLTYDGTQSQGTKIIEFSEVGGFWQADIIYNMNFPNQYHSIYTGDFNGDGKGDLLTSNGTDWDVSYSTGVGFHTVEFAQESFLEHSTSLARIMISDINGDGYSDIVEFEYDSQSDVSVFKSKGMNFIKYTDLSTVLVDEAAMFINGDFDGDGRQDFYFHDGQSGHSPLRMYRFMPSVQNRLVQKISDGYDYNTRFKYRTLSQTSSTEPLYEKGASLSYPLSKTNAPFHVVYETNIPDGVHAHNSVADDIVIQYKYKGAVIHQQGRGFLGFESFSKKNLSYNQNVERFVHFEIQPTVYLAKSSGSEVYISGNIIKSTEIDNNYLGLNNDRWWLKTNSITAKDYINMSSDITEYSDYDNYGNVEEATTYIGKYITGSGNYQKMVEKSISYISMHSNVNPSIIDHKAVTYTRYGKPSKTKEIEYNYLGHRLLSEITWPGLPKEVTTTFSNYNSFGLPEQVQVSSAGLLTKTNQMIYDSRGRYVEQRVNPMSQSIFTTYDEVTGKTLSSTDIQGNTTTYTYDDAYRLETTTDYLYNISYTSYDWDIQTGTGANATQVANAWYHKSMSKPGSPSKVIHYDILDRPRLTSVDGFSNQPEASTVIQYTKSGKIKTKTLPFDIMNPSTAAITTYTYDSDLGHLVEEAMNNGGDVITYQFENTPGNNVLAKHQKQTISNSSGVVWKMTDMVGKVITSHDDGGDLNFEYDSWGKTTTISDGNNTVLSESTYDQYGRQATYMSLGSGQTSREYDAYGRLIEEVDPLNNTTTLGYDLLDKLVYRIGPEGNTNFNYVSSGNGINKIQNEFGFNGINKNYDYDAYGRLEKIEIPFGYAESITLSYDSYGRLYEKEYNAGFKIRYYYDTHGYLDRLEFIGGSSNTTLLNANSTDMFGQYNDFTLGNGKNSLIQSDPFGMPVNYYTSNVQDLTMDWDPGNGNLNYRKDAFNTVGSIGVAEEHFNYDNLQRLDYSQIISGSYNPSAFGTSLNSIGDYQSKHDAGTEYSYYNQQKVKEVKNDNTNIPLATQTVTYNSFNEPETINEDVYDIEFIYGSDRKRVQSRITEQGVPGYSEIRYYSDDLGYEVVRKNGTVNHLYYVSLAANTMAIIRLTELDDESLPEDPPGGGGSGGGTTTSSLTALGMGGEGDPVGGGGGDDIPANPEGDIYYVYKDHLGSWISVTDNSGTVIATQNFDAWGRRRNADDWHYSSNSNNPDWLIRGFTGHEHFDQVGIIHMNGRLYDPMIGRMFSADNNVSDQFNTQAYNRYSYALNNPLKFKDPDGELIITTAFVVGTIWAASMNAYAAYEAGQNAGLGNRHLAMYTIGAGAIGVGTAFIGAGLSKPLVSAMGGSMNPIISHAIAGGVTGGLTGFIGGSGGAALANKYLGTELNVWKSGLFAGGIGLASGSAMGALEGYASQNSSMSFAQETGKEPILPVHDDLEYTTEFAANYLEDNFPHNPKLKHVFADGTPPPRSDWKLDGGQFSMVDDAGQTIYSNAVTINAGRKSAIFFAPNSMSHPIKWHITAGHEVLHSHMIAHGLVDQNLMHRSIHEWQVGQAKMHNYNVDTYNNRLQITKTAFDGKYENITPNYDYSNFGF